MLDGAAADKHAMIQGVRRYFLSPGDPTAQGDFRDHMYRIDGTNRFEFPDGGPTSYAFNMVGFLGPVRFPTAISDGTSHTIAFAERYFESLDQSRIALAGQDVLPRSWLMYGFCDAAYQSPFPPHPLNNLGNRRPSFADAGWGDVVPVTTGSPPITQPSRPGAKFQVRPSAAEADMYLPQTPFSAGLPVALFDGSVRTIRPGVRTEVFWAMVTPAGGEVMPGD
jgi:hypothetical protein